MLLGFTEFLKANWIWLTLGLIIVICIIVLLCTDKKDAPSKAEEPQNTDPEIPEPGQDPEPAPEEEQAVAPAPEPEEEPAPVSESEPEPVSDEEPIPEPEEEPVAEPAPVSEEETPAEPEPEPEVDEDDHNDVEVRHPDAKKSDSGYRVVYDRETFTWVVKKDNNTRVTRRVKTKKEALEIAKELSKRQDVNMTVHKKDGKFQKKQK